MPQWVKILPACNAGDAGLIHGSGRSHGEGNGNPLQYSCLKTPMDRGTWSATVHGVAESDTNEVLLLLLLSLKKQARKWKVRFTKINRTNSENITTRKSVLKTAKVLIIKEPNKWKKSFWNFYLPDKDSYIYNSFSLRITKYKITSIFK